MRRSILFLAMLAMALPAPARAEPTADAGLRRFLRAHVGRTLGIRTRATRIVVGHADLDGDGRDEALVTLSGPDWCGSGGCRLWILAPHARSWRLVTQLTVVNPPVRVLRTRTRGWRDMAVTVAGGGIVPGYEAVLRFDGRSYPRNPSLLPAERGPRPAGTVILSGREPDSALFP